MNTDNESSNRDYEAKYRELTDSLPQIVFEADTQGNLIFANNYSFKIYGYEREDLQRGLNIFDLLVPEEHDRARASIREMLQSDNRPPAEYTALRKDGSTFPILVNTSRVMRGDTPVGFRGVIMDITEHKRMEEIVNKVRDLSLALGGVRDWREGIRMCLRVALEISGMEGGGAYLVNHTDRSLHLQAHEGLPAEFVSRVSVYPEDSPNAKLVYQGAPLYIRTSELDPAMVKAVFPEGVYLLAMIPILHEKTVIGCFNFISGVLDEFPEILSGVIETLVAQVGNVIARLQAEEALRESEERFRAAFRVSPDSININRLSDGVYIDINDGFTETTGYTREDVIGKSSLELNIWVNPEDRKALAEGLKTNGYVNNLEAQFRMKSGAVITGLMSARLLSMEGEQYILSVTRDITDRKRLEQQFHQSQKMETIGRLAGGIAHDFNNILTVINGNAEMSLMFSDIGDASREAFEEIRKSGERAAALTRQLLAFSRKQIVEPQVIYPNALLLNMDKMLRRLIGEHIELITIPAETLRTIWADPGQIEQVLTNLVVNARDAMPEGGKVTIETRNVQLDEEYAKTHPETSPGDYIMFAVTDTGIGMDEETRSHIFEPFFTTKPKGSGTGLGLSTCYGIVKQNKGGIWVYSEPGKGTSVKVYFPVYENAAISGGSSRTADLPRGTETILVVEDDPGIRNLVTRLLQKTGYRVRVASNGSEALPIIDGSPDVIHLLITDVVMPLMGGKELADYVSEERPDIKILFMSGYTDDSIVHHGILEEGIKFIQKPFTPGDFLRKVRETLG